MHQFRHVMVALPRTEADAGLIRYAAMLARLGPAVEVHFLHALSTAVGPAAASECDRVLADLEAEVRAQFTDAPGTARVHCDVLKGPLTDRLLEFAAEQAADLILVGHQEGPADRRARVLARRLAMQAPCSVWMVPFARPAQLTRILVPVDFSEHAADALAVGASLAQRAGHDECLALHVWRHKVQVEFEGIEAKVRHEKSGAVSEAEDAESFRRLLETVAAFDVRVIPLHESGAHVAHTIQRTAIEQKADLIVMATRGRTRSASILLGSVTEDLLLESRLPVLVVKHFGARRRLLEVLLGKSLGR